MKIFSLLSVLLLLLYCSKQKPEIQHASKNTTQTLREASDQKPRAVTVSEEQKVKSLNDSILKAFQDKNYAEVANFIHPEKGVTFSMYGFVDPARAKNFSKETFLKYLPTSVKFTWGQKDGSGELLILPIKDYLEKWVYSRNFASAEFHFNSFRGTGNTLNNLEKVFPEAVFTENYVAGSEKLGEMDWNALRFVFEKYEGQYFLVAVVNDQWTI